MNLPTLQRLATTRPKIVLDWALRFPFYRQDEVTESEYPKLLLFAFNTINQATEKNPKLIIPWLIEKRLVSTNHQGGLRLGKSFGRELGLPFRDLDHWIESIYANLIKTKPKLFSVTVHHALYERADWNRYSRIIVDHAKAMFMIHPVVTLLRIRDIWAKSERHGSNRKVEWVCESILIHAYKQNPDRVFDFFEKIGPKLHEFGDIMDTVIRHCEPGPKTQID
jgi:hypothetical protein